MFSRAYTYIHSYILRKEIMNITEAVRELTNMLGQHGNLQLVNEDGDLIDFSFCPRDSPYCFPTDVILVAIVD